MIKAAAAAHYIDEASIVCESAVAMYRAGADMLITYYAKELAGYMKEGRIGQLTSGGKELVYEYENRRVKEVV